MRPPGESTDVANLFSQLKQWSNRITGSDPKSAPGSRSVRTRDARNRPPGASSERAQAIRTSGQLPIGSARKPQPQTAPVPAAVGVHVRVGKRPPYKRVRFWLLLLLGAGVAGPSARLYALYSNLQDSVPDVTKALTYERSGTITLKAEDGKVLQKVGPTAQESLSFDEIPQIVTEAFIAAEDRRFYEHNGVDYRSIARATVANVTSGGVVEGASTITQQLARLTFLNQDQSFQRKFREAILAQKLEEE